MEIISGFPQLALRFLNSIAAEEVTEGQESRSDFRSQVTGHRVKLAYFRAPPLDIMSEKE